jgi:hypothetical protein
MAATTPTHKRLMAADKMSPLSAMLTRFLVHNAVREEGARTLHADVARRFRGWLGSDVGDKAITRRLTEMGYETQRSNGKTYWRGLVLVVSP